MTDETEPTAPGRNRVTSDRLLAWLEHHPQSGDRFRVWFSTDGAPFFEVGRTLTDLAAALPATRLGARRVRSAGPR